MTRPPPSPSDPPPGTPAAEAADSLPHDGLDRRTFLRLLGAAGVGGYLTAAGCERGETLLPTGPGEPEPFATWREVRRALRTSPDHFPARAQALVREGDPDAIARFVREDLVTLPGEAWGMGRADRARRWGPRAALRCGAGTPREKAELLARLLTEAGQPADVVVGPAPSPGEVEAAVLRPPWSPRRAFAPELPEGALRDWRDRLGVRDEGRFVAIDPGAERSAGLAEELMAVLPDEAAASSAFDWRSGSLPAVRLGGEDGRILHPVLPGEPDPRAGWSPAPPADPTPTVQVTLSAAVSMRPGERFPLVRGRWRVDELAGRQLGLRFVPGLPMERLITAEIRDVRVFLPVLALQALDGLPDAEGVEVSVAGEAVTLAGERLSVEDDGTVYLDAVPLVGPGAGSPGVAEVLLDEDFLDLDMPAPEGAPPGWEAENAYVYLTARGLAGRHLEVAPASGGPHALSTARPLALEPGTYRLSFLARTRRGGPEAGLRVALGSHLDEPLRLGEGEAFQPVRRTFEVAEAGSHRLRLSASGEPAPVVDLKEVRLVRLDAGAPGPSVAEVAAIEAEVDASSFPRLGVAFRAVDAAGEPVPGLAATDFQVEEQGETSGVLMTRNRATPRVLLLHDQSGSMPPEYLGEAMARFLADLERAVQADFPGAVLQRVPTNSNLWSWLLRASATGADALVYVTDGHVDDRPPTPEQRRTLAAGPPAAVVSVYDQAGGVFEELAQATGGVALPVAEAEQAKAAILGFLGGLDVPPYHLRLRASSDEPGERAVVLRTADGRVETREPYRAPAPAERAPAPHLSGLFLTVEVEDRTVTRTLAGYEGTDPAAVTPGHTDAVRDALWSDLLLSFEGGAPALSVWMDDAVTARLTLAPFFEVGTGGTLEECVQALENGVAHAPPEPFIQAAAVPLAREDGSLTFPDLVQASLWSRTPVIGTDTVVEALDILPLARFSTASPGEATNAFRTTLRRTALRAFAEAEAHRVSTASLLEGTSLRLAHRADLPQDMDPPERARWARLLDRGFSWAIAPEGWEPMALWDVDRRTGEVLGILADGTGGSREAQAIKEQIEEWRRVMAYYNLVFTVGLAVAGRGGLALSVVAAYGEMLVKLYGAVALVLITLDGALLEETVRQELLSFACAAADEVFLSIGGGLVADAEAITYAALGALLGPNDGLNVLPGC